MPTAAALRREIERTLENRFPAALSPVQQEIRQLAPTGIPGVDAVLEGGLPVGAISEVAGPESSGRTSLVLAFLAQRTREGQVCAWVDACDSLDPESAAASGVALKQLLWVRCRNGRGSAKGKPWTSLDQAVRATDLLLKAGGFAAIVLDLGEIAPEHASRIPLATWFRFRQAAHCSRATLVVMGQDAYAQSSAAVVLRCAPLSANTAGESVLDGFQFAVRRERQRFTPSLNAARKPPASTWSASAWSAGAAWDVERRA